MYVILPNEANRWASRMVAVTYRCFRESFAAPALARYEPRGSTYTLGKHGLIAPRCIFENAAGVVDGEVARRDA